MKLLWFEFTEPAAYVSEKLPIGGWQDSLERIVRTIPEVELTIVFVSKRDTKVKTIEGVTYIPIFAKWSFRERVFRKYWDLYVEKVIPKAREIIHDYRPDIIQVFGTEWPLGQIAAYTDIPVVIHIMGAIVPYHNASFPPGYSLLDAVVRNWWKPQTLFRMWIGERDIRNREEWELRTWRLVNYYMGRTQWDFSLSNVMHPGRHYFHVEEALRNEFVTGMKKWHFPSDGKLRLVSTGCGSYWKGLDMMLKVGRVLIDLGVDFEWKVAGKMNPTMKSNVESHEGVRFEDCNIEILGNKNPAELMNILCESSMYVHTAYIENSPNSICEAQCLGIPVVSTNVGGIASLVNDGKDGILVAANDPWQMADAIMRIWKDKEMMKRMSESTLAHAKQRHKDEHILKQLMDSYETILKCHKGEGCQ